MNRAYIVRESFTWIPVGLIPIADGLIRMATYGNAMDPDAAGALSAFSDILFICAYALFLEWQRPVYAFGFRRGGLWFALSNASHFLLGHYVFGMSWRALVGKYDITAGESWIAVAIMIGVAPVLARRARRRLA